MKRLKVGLNGFGRIGRAFTRIALTRDKFDIALINTRKTPVDMLAYLLKYDSVYRTYDKPVGVDGEKLVAAGKSIPTSKQAEPSQIAWEQEQVNVVIDATGAFENTEDLKKHLRGSVKKVVLTAPSKDDEMPHVVLGVNDRSLDLASCSIMSNASCTTNCASPMFKVLDDNFKVLTGFLTTSHAVTATQSILDDPAKSKERSRAAFQNIVPSTTGASKAVVKTMPHLAGKIDGMSIRVPVPTVSFSDISAIVQKETTVEEVNRVYKEASEGSMKGILGYETDVLVSSDFIGSPYSVVFDANYTKVIGGHMVKVFGWYDNEWGYSMRLVDLVESLSPYF